MCSGDNLHKQDDIIHHDLSTRGDGSWAATDHMITPVEEAEKLKNTKKRGFDVVDQELFHLPHPPTSSHYNPKAKPRKRFVSHNYHDRSQDKPPPEGGMKMMKVAKGGVSETFPLKLHRMLTKIEETEGNEHIVSWQPHGRCFHVHEINEFVQTVMPRFFSQNKFPSFQRQLNLYGFSRITIGPDKGSYYHEYFLRGMEFLVHNIQRQKIKGAGGRSASNPDQEPNFYSMTYIPLGIIDEDSKSMNRKPTAEATQEATQEDQEEVSKVDKPILSDVIVPSAGAATSSSSVGPDDLISSSLVFNDTPTLSPAIKTKSHDENTPTSPPRAKGFGDNVSSNLDQEPNMLSSSPANDEDDMNERKLLIQEDQEETIKVNKPALSDTDLSLSIAPNEDLYSLENTLTSSLTIPGTRSSNHKNVSSPLNESKDLLNPDLAYSQLRSCSDIDSHSSDTNSMSLQYNITHEDDEEQQLLQDEVTSNKQDIPDTKLIYQGITVGRDAHDREERAFRKEMKLIKSLSRLNDEDLTKCLTELINM